MRVNRYFLCDLWGSSFGTLGGMGITMLLKIIGSAVVVATTSILGYALSINYKRRPAELRELQGLLQMLENEIGYLSNLLVDAFEKISRSSRSKTVIFFNAAAENLKSCSSIGASNAWEKAVRDNIETTSLNKEDEEILVSFGKMLGISDVEGQIKNIRLLQSQLKLQEQKAEESRQKNERMYKSLGVLGGIAIVIMLI